MPNNNQAINTTPNRRDAAPFALVALVVARVGAIADHSSLSVALFVPVACYAIIAGFSWYSRRPAVAFR